MNKKELKSKLFTRFIGNKPANLSVGVNTNHGLIAKFVGAVMVMVLTFAAAMTGVSTKGPTQAVSFTDESATQTQVESATQTQVVIDARRKCVMLDNGIQVMVDDGEIVSIIYDDNDNGLKYNILKDELGNDFVYVAKNDIVIGHVKYSKINNKVDEKPELAIKSRTTDAGDVVTEFTSASDGSRIIYTNSNTKGASAVIKDQYGTCLWDVDLSVENGLAEIVASYADHNMVKSLLSVITMINEGSTDPEALNRFLLDSASGIVEYVNGILDERNFMDAIPVVQPVSPMERVISEKTDISRSEDVGRFRILNNGMMVLGEGEDTLGIKYEKNGLSYDIDHSLDKDVIYVSKDWTPIGRVEIVKMGEAYRVEPKIEIKPTVTKSRDIIAKFMYSGNGSWVTYTDSRTNGISIEIKSLDDGIVTEKINVVESNGMVTFTTATGDVTCDMLRIVSSSLYAANEGYFSSSEDESFLLDNAWDVFFEVHQALAENNIKLPGEESLTDSLETNQE